MTATFHNTTIRKWFRRTLRPLAVTVLGLLLSAGAAGTADAASRIKDIVDFQGVRENLLVSV